MAERLLRSGSSLYRLGAGLVDAGRAGCCCGGGGGGRLPDNTGPGPTWPTRGYIILAPCPGAAATDHVPVINPGPYDASCLVARVGSRFADPPYTTCYFATAASPVFDYPPDEPLPHPYYLTSATAGSCCLCRMNADQSCRTDPLAAALPTSVIRAMLASCPEKVTLNGLARALLVDNAAVDCCCGPIETRSYAGSVLYVATFRDGNTTCQDRYEMQYVSSGGVVVGPDGTRAKRIEVTDRWTYCDGTTEGGVSEVDSARCGPWPLGPWDYWLGFSLWGSTEDLCAGGRVSLSLTCDGISATGVYEEPNPNAALIRATFTLVGSVSRNAGDCDRGCRDGLPPERLDGPPGGIGGGPGPASGCAGCGGDGGLEVS